MSLATLGQSSLDLLLEGLPHVPIVALCFCEIKDLWDLIELEVARDEGVLAVNAHSSVLVVQLDEGRGGEVERGLLVEQQSDLVEEGSGGLNLAILLQYFLN